MRKLRCCVIDDEPLAQELIKGYIIQTPFLEFVDSFPSASRAVKTIIESDIDVVFLDIQMSELNGIEFARVVPQKCRIIFVTAFEQYAVEAFRANALDYLLKPVNYSEFLVAANKALKWFELVEKAESRGEDDQQYIIIKSEYKLIQIAVSNILYIEGLKDYVRIYLEDNGGVIMSLMSLKSLEGSLPASKFLRVHRSFIVQTSKIKMIERNRIVFGKQYIPISDTYKTQFMEYINHHTLSPIKDVD
ncbi:MAG: LytTR family DNA-binding domain-containing protein [Muribaculaceae bacterium]|jgi:two-component system LytT family response regulator|nr:LytTR family DNA-binding domain-containing protein [Muribaculaceae bacterium]